MGQETVAGGRAYADPYSQSELESFRSGQSRKEAIPVQITAPYFPGSDGSQPLRFMSEPKAYHWHDEVLGDLLAGPEVIDDFIILKSDGYPTYNFAHIIDDYLMKVSHVIRSQEFTASVPRFLNLYEALEIERPLLEPYHLCMWG